MFIGKMDSSVKFSNGLRMPVLGLGTWTSPPDKMKLAVGTALETGYRHIDCAFVYSNEKEIGNALEEYMKKFSLKREDIFITSKCWCTYMRPELVRKCCEQSLSDLKLSYLDLYLIHWPVPLRPGDVNFPKLADGTTFDMDKVPLLDTWEVSISD
ncbi:Aldo-keto reductase family 1 member B4 (Aldose reductase) [Paragonimus heterotremus]|uniref:Aldo-keto reductase family 1 member B4 (Aldose reductase) n=1 Tax=Paragonimus heterotremus TaxID=100268 RepID=A0A8J4WD79_9TREM|nr:Aldo-keto reductase family 1 member B4 (Aldose reductase) [Paragonimus heterotremus]